MHRAWQMLLLCAVAQTYILKPYRPSRSLNMRSSEDDPASARFRPILRLKRALVSVSFAAMSVLPLLASPGRADAKSASTKTAITLKVDEKGVKGDARRQGKGNASVVVEVQTDRANQQYTRIGLALAAVTVLYTLLAPDNKIKSKTKGKVERVTKPSPSTKVRTTKDSLAPENREIEDDIFDEDPSTASNTSVAMERRDKSTGSKKPESEDLLDTADDVTASLRRPAPERTLRRDVPSSPAPAPANPVTQPPKEEQFKAEVKAPIKPPEKKTNIFDKIFKKAGSGRPVSLSDALLQEDAESPVRRTMARALLVYAPSDCFIDTDVRPFDAGDDAIQLLSSAVASAGLSRQEGAELFAGLASAMTLAIVDHTISILDDRELKKPEIEAAVVASLDELAIFINAVGQLFGELFADTMVEPVVYAGKAKRNKIEDAYCMYTKACMNIKDILAQAQGEAGEEAGSPTDLRADNLGKIQLVLGIKESKRSSLEQRALKDMVMNMANGEGMADLGGMFEAMNGKSGDMSGVDPKVMDEVMAQMSAQGGFPSGRDGMSDLKPEEVPAYVANLVQSVKEGLKSGEITGQEVKELEKIIGMDLKKFVTMVDKGGVDMNKLRGVLGPDAGELIEIFRELSKMK